MLVVAGCNVDHGPPTGPLEATSDIGPSGGRVSVGGVEVEVPPNAVHQKTAITISIEPTNPAGYTVDGSVYRFEPEGLVFSKPITVSFPTSAPNHVVFWTRLGSTDSFEPLATTIEGANTIAHPSGREILVWAQDGRNARLLG